MTRNFKKKLNPIWVANTRQCTGPIRIATVNDITRKIETSFLNTPQNPYINQATPKKCLPKLTFPKQSWNRKFQTQNNPLGFHVSKNRRRILSAPLLTMTGFRKGWVQIFCLRKPTKSGPSTNMLKKPDEYVEKTRNLQWRFLSGCLFFYTFCQFLQVDYCFLRTENFTNTCQRARFCEHHHDCSSK